MHETNEPFRKILHVAIGAGAVVLKVLNWRIAALICAFAAAGNWLLLHRIVGKRVSRHERGWDAGIVLYPLAVCALIILFNRHLEIAATSWVILAAGDGFGTLISLARPSSNVPLPWNPAKSWNGFAAFILLGIPATAAIAAYFDALNWPAIIAAVVVAAIVETLPLRIDDNLTVPFAAAATLTILTLGPTIPWESRPPIAGVWLIVNTVLAVAGYFLRTVDWSGAIAGWILGSIIVIGGGPAMYVALLAFFVVGTAATKLGYRTKAESGLAQEKGGRRGAGHAIANVGAAAACAIACWRGLGLVPLFIGIASLATAAADTVGSEIGQLFGKRAFLPLTFRRVERGTEGAISMEGTLAGVAGAAIVAIAGTAMAAHQLRRGFIGNVTIDKTAAIVAVTACGVIGSYLESVIGSVTREIPNHAMNFINTVAGALLFWIAWQLVPIFHYVFF